jgi:hypothetical protein
MSGTGSDIWGDGRLRDDGRRKTELNAKQRSSTPDGGSGSETRDGILQMTRDGRQGFNRNRGGQAQGARIGYDGGGSDQGLGKSKQWGQDGGLGIGVTGLDITAVPFDIQADTDVHVSVLEFELTGHTLDSTFEGGFFEGSASGVAGAVCSIPDSGLGTVLSVLHWVHWRGGQRDGRLLTPS